MKLEIDISNRVELNKLKTELSRYLKVVDFAISELDSGKPNFTDGQLSLMNGNGHTPIGKFDERVSHIITTLPKRFNTTDVMIQIGDDAKENRGSIKLALKRAVENERITVAQAGVGRRPTVYEQAG
jgi:hypothetical protein